VKIRHAICLSLAFMATAAFGQANAPVPPASTSNTTVVPIWNTQSGHVDGLMLIEPSVLPQMPSERIIGAPTNNHGLQLKAGLSLEANPGIGVLCAQGSTITSVGSMAGHCMLVNLSEQQNAGANNNINGLISLQKGRTSVTGSAGMGRDNVVGNSPLIGNVSADRRLIDSLLGPAGSATLDSRNASLIGQVNLGTQSWVSIGGTLARVRVIPTDQLRGDLPPEFGAGSLRLSGGRGNLGAEITGQMIEVPGQANRYSTLGAGVTWRMPWKARLSVGADNLVTRGKNPFGTTDAHANDTEDEGRVPYVRYQQDL
jgi:hypothetical protein